MKIEEGKFYRLRFGEIIGPMESFDSDEFKFCFGTAAWREDGTRRFDHKPDETDIVEEVPNPALPQSMDHDRELIDFVFEQIRDYGYRRCPDSINRIHAAFRSKNS